MLKILFETDYFLRYHGVNILLTGDKDFLETDIATPKIISPSDLLENFLRRGTFYG